jgi:Zn-dependent peptidase ImmA (M78 family)
LAGGARFAGDGVLGDPDPNEIPQSEWLNPGFLAPPEGRPDIMLSQAQQILVVHKVNEPPVPIEQIAKELGATINYLPFDGDGDLAGMLVRTEGKTIIGVNALHHMNRQRFTIAHECGHLVLHKDEVHIDRKFSVKRRDQISSLAIDPQEIEANRFAAELLMPFDMIVNELIETDLDYEDAVDLKRLCSKYKVSAQAMSNRLSNIIEYEL